MPIEPTLAELLESTHRSFMLDLHVCLPAVTRAYTSATQRGDFLPVIKGARQDSDGANTYEARPVIQNVPVRWERAGGYYSHSPLAVGDHGWLIFSEDCYAQWRTTGEVSVPGDLTRHSLSYPFFLPGAWPDDDPLPDAPTGHAVSIVPAGGFLRVSKAASALAQFVALATKVDAQLSALKSAIGAAATTEAGASGLGGMTALNGALSAWPLAAGTAATSLKSD